MHLPRFLGVQEQCDFVFAHALSRAVGKADKRKGCFAPGRAATFLQVRQQCLGRQCCGQLATPGDNTSSSTSMCVPILAEFPVVWRAVEQSWTHPGRAW